MLLTAEDISCFRDAGGDANPLHVSPEFARATPFGAPIAHGVLGVLAVLDHSAAGDGIAELDVTFRNPITPGVRYTVAGTRNPEQWTVRDGTRDCFDLTVVPGPRASAVPSPGRPSRGAGQCAEHLLSGLGPGVTAAGAYGAPAAALRALSARFPRAAERLGELHLTALLWCSYLAGMELPGRYGVLSGVRLTLHRPVRAGALRYAAEVVDVDARFGVVTVGAVLLSGDDVVAQCELEALVREPVGPPSLTEIRRHLAPSGRLAGRTAVVVGGSRGLGAAVAVALADQGCAVLVGHRGPEQDAAPVVTAAEPAAGSIRSVPGAADDPAWSRRLDDQLDRGAGAVDLLVCAAGPVVRPVDLRPDDLDRLHEHVNTGLRTVTAPLGALLPRLEAARGRCLLVSSSAVRELPAEWPHYVILKSGIEGFARWAAVNHPAVAWYLTRPGLLRTDARNTPAASAVATAVEPVAAALVDRLAGGPRPVGELQVIDVPGAGVPAPGQPPGAWAVPTA